MLAAQLRQQRTVKRLGKASIGNGGVDALLRGRFITDPFRRRRVVLAICLLGGILAAAALYRLGPATAPVLAGTLVVAAFAGGYAALLAGVRLPPVAPSLTIGGVYALTAAYRYALSTRERRMIKRAFQQRTEDGRLDVAPLASVRLFLM